jgi:hypothetical protein
VNHVSVAAGGDGLDSGVQHGVDEYGVWSRTNRPADDHAVEELDHGQQVRAIATALACEGARLSCFIRRRQIFSETFTGYLVSEACIRR